MPPPYRVLLAEDDQLLRSLNRYLLEATQQVKIVGEAEDGEETLQLAKKVQPDAILLDLSMPGRDGMSTLPELRKLLPDCRIIVVSMLQRSGIEQEVLRMGASAFIDKGHESDDFVRHVLAILAAPRTAPAPKVVRQK